MQCDERPVLYGSTSDTTAIIPQISVSSTFSPPVSQKFVEKEVFEDVIVKENVPIFEAKKNVTVAAAVAPLDEGCVHVKDVELFFIPEIVVQMENEVIECDKKGEGFFFTLTYFFSKTSQIFWATFDILKQPT